MRNLYFIMFTMLIILCSCKRTEWHEVRGTLNYAFDEAAEQQKYLFVVSSIGDCPACRIFTDNLFASETLKRKMDADFLIYQCDRRVVGNEYLFYIANSVASPTVYIFDKDGKIVNTFAGIKNERETDSLIELTLAGQINTAMASPRLRVQGKALLGLLNDVFSAHRIISARESSMEAIDTAIKRLEKTTVFKPYFYNHYLLSKAYRIQGKTDQANRHAAEALQFSDGYSQQLYEDIYAETAKSIGVSDPSLWDASKLAFEELTYDFQTITPYSREEAVFHFVNKSSQDVNITNVLGNCSCMQIDFPKQAIPPGKSGTIKVQYKADVNTGSFSKVLFVSDTSVDKATKLTLTGIVK